MTLRTPHYLIDERRMLPALERIRHVERTSGAKSVLALKCFSSWRAFEGMRPYFAGTTSSGLYEARLGHEEFGGETHGYGVAFDEDEVRELVGFCDKLIFNSLGQLERFAPLAGGVSLGLRVNPGLGHSHHRLSDPVQRYSRLGVPVHALPPDLGSRVRGVMTHVNCDNDDFANLSRQLDHLEDVLAPHLPALEWLSLGGGIAFTGDDYPLDDLCRRLSDFAARHSVQLYLEPGEAAVTNSTSLVVTVLDVVDNEVPTAIVDAGVETHLLDVLTYDFTPALEGAVALDRDPAALASLRALHPNVHRICGRTCLAGDHFGTYAFAEPLRVGQRLRFTDVGGYSMVKKNHFNGIRMPAIHLRRIDGEIVPAREPTYDDFRDALA